MSTTKIALVGLLPAQDKPKKGFYHVYGRIGNMDFVSLEAKTTEQLARELAMPEAGLKRLIKK